MGHIKKQSIYSFIYSYIGLVIGFVNIIIIQPNFLQSDEIGVLRLLLSASSIIAMLMPLGIGSITMRFFPKFKNEENRHNGHFTMMLLFSIAGFIIFGGLLLMSRSTLIEFYINKSAKFINYIDLVSLFAFILSLIAIYSIYSSSLYYSSITFLLSEVFIRLGNIAIVILYHYDIILIDTLIYSFIGIYCLQLLILLYFLSIKKAISFKIEWQTYRNLNWKKMLTYGTIMIVTAVASLGIKLIDQLIIGHYLDLSYVGIYSVCVYMISILEAPFNSMERISNAKMADAWEKNDLDIVKKIYFNSVKYLVPIGLLIFGLLWTQRENIFFFLPEEYKVGLFPLQVLAIASLVNLSTGMNGSLIAMSNKYIVGTLFLFFLLVCSIVLNWFLIPFWGINGAAIATAVSIIIFNLMKFIYILYRYKMQPFNLNSIKLLLLSILSILGCELLPLESANIIISIIVKALVYLIIFGIGILYINPVSETNQLIKFLKKIR
ncbi:MAG: polysaccharide biosynthesis C-terminal domain-containing protein [Bacteroidia bacterium]|jgi:O-antigen/teichoic acid export membrane protein|nr:polysaccharide biosynthesis C-terminal domain-containing protein [Bacteroidia bacterium]